MSQPFAVWDFLCCGQTRTEPAAQLDQQTCSELRFWRALFYFSELARRSPLPSACDLLRNVFCTHHPIPHPHPPHPPPPSFPTLQLLKVVPRWLYIISPSAPLLAALKLKQCRALKGDSPWLHNADDMLFNVSRMPVSTLGFYASRGK